MEEAEEDEFLSLRLSVSAAGGRSAERKNKVGKIIKRDYLHTDNNNNSHHHHQHHNNATTNCNIPMMISSINSSSSSSFSSSPSYEGYEGKIFRLLQMREMMLRHDNHNHHNNNNDNGLPLIHLLLRTATAVDERNLSASLENLTELYQTVSLTGDSVQRVVAYFADGLAARLLTRKSPFYEMLMEEAATDEEEQFLAFTDLYRASPYYQFAHFTANQAILEAFEHEEDTNNRALHVIDFDVSYGFQWPSLIQSLSDKATPSNRISLRITAFGNSMKDLQETESRLLSFSKGFKNLVFEFQGLLRDSNPTVVINLCRKKRKNETVAVNLVSYLNNNSGCCVKMWDMLSLVESLKPSVVLLVKQEGSRSMRTFLSRFTETLQYFAAMFDSLDDCLPLESAERLRIEKKLLGKEIKGVMNLDGSVDCPKYERMEAWKARMESHGFVATKISSKSLMQAKLLLKMRTHYYCPLQFQDDNNNNNNGNVSAPGFRISQRDEGRAISLGWQNRFLLTVSAWQCNHYHS